MKTRSKYFLAFIFSALFLTSCGDITTYKKENLIQSIVDICQKEHNIKDVKVSLKGKTLYLYMVLPNILSETFKLSDETSERLENIVFTTTRVCLSTDADVKFYRVVASDEKNLGIQFILTRYIPDINRYMLGDISRNDYTQRMDIKVVINPVVIGYSTVKMFFKDLQTQTPAGIMQNYFPTNIKYDNIAPVIYPLLEEIAERKNKKIEILESRNKIISESKALIWCKTHETYDNKIDSALFPQDFYNEYLFSINTNAFPKLFDGIYCLFNKEDNKLVYKGIPEKFSKYADLSKWDVDMSGEIDLQVPEFLCDVIEYKLKTEFKNDKKLSALFKLNALRCRYIEAENKEKFFVFEINAIKNNSPEALNLLDNYYIDIFKECIDMVTFTLRRYDFTDFNKLKFIYTPKSKEIILENSQLEDYKKNKISINNLVHPIQQISVIDQKTF